MTRLFTFILLVTFLTQGFSQAQWMWAKQIAGRNNTSGGGFLGKDNTGSLYLAGDFTDTRTFGASNITAIGYSDAFVTKMDSAGNVIWTEQAGGNQANIDVKGSFTTPGGKTYLTGKFNGTVSFGGITLTATSPFDDMFIACYENDGSVNYAVKFGGSGSNAGFTEGRAIYADDIGNIWVTGAFSSSISFGSIVLVAGDQYVTDIFVLKITGGSVDWANRAGSPTEDDKGNAICVEANGNVFITGYFRNIADFGPINLTSNGTKDMFLAKYSSNGIIDWVINAGGTNVINNAVEANAIKTDQNNNIYVTGRMNGNNVNFGSGVILNEIQQQGAFYGDFFVAKYNSSGTVLWAKNGGGNSVTDSGNAMDLDADGNVYITGSFQGTNANFNGVTLTSAGVGDAFVLKYTSAGIVSWANRLGAGNDDVGLSIIVDGTNKAYVSGYFTGNVSVGPSTISSPAGTWQIFLARMDAGNTAVNELSQLPFDIYPNPSNDVLYIDGSRLTNIEITDQTGRLVYLSELNTVKTRHDISHLEKGIYFIKVGDGKSTGTKKLVVN